MVSILILYPVGFFLTVLFLSSFKIFRTRSISIPRYKKKDIFLLTLILLFALFFRFQQPLEHAIFMDEETHFLHQAKLISEDFINNFCFLNPLYQGGECLTHVLNNKIGFVLILAITFSIIGGFNFYVPFFINIAFGIACILAVFFITKELFGNKAALIAASLLALLPEHITWSVTASTEISALFFYFLSSLFFLFYIKKQQTALIIASLSSSGLAFAIRPEMAFIFVLELMLALFIKRKDLRSLFDISFENKALLTILLLSFISMAIYGFYLSFTYWNGLWSRVYGVREIYSINNFFNNVYNLFYYNFKIKNLLFLSLIAGFFIGIFSDRKSFNLGKLFYLFAFLALFFWYTPFFLGAIARDGAPLVHSRFPMIWLSFSVIIAGKGISFLLDKLKWGHISYAVVLIVAAIYLQINSSTLIYRGDEIRAREKAEILSIENANRPCTFITTDYPAREELYGFKGIGAGNFINTQYPENGCFIFLEPKVCKYPSYKKECMKLLSGYSWDLVDTNEQVNAWKLNNSSNYKFRKPERINYNPKTVFLLINDMFMIKQDERL